MIRFHREQPIDLYPSLWDRLSDLLAGGRAVVPREAQRELESRDDDVQRWLRQRSSCVVEATAPELDVVVEIARRHPLWVLAPRTRLTRS